MIKSLGRVERKFITELAMNVYWERRCNAND